MSKPKHTQGPWDAPEMSPDGKRIIVTGGSDEWERMGCEIDSDDCCSETAMANARLIAAAPELLDALVGLLGCIRETRGPDSRAAELAAYAAIAKATVERP